MSETDLRRRGSARPAVRQWAARFAPPAAGMLLLFAIATVLSALTGGIPGEFGGHADEGAHYVTGLLVHDYLVAPLPQSPLNYALRYYAHYPAIAFGHWPPLFYVLEALWMFVFGVSRLALVLFVQLSAAILAWQFAKMVAAKYGLRAGLVAGVTLLTITVVRRQALFVSPELLMCAFMLMATAAYARLLQSHDWRDGLAFGIASSAAILTKGNALALALVPPLMALFDRDIRIVRSRALWAGTLVVGVCAGVWQVLTIGEVAYGWEGDAGWRFAAATLSFFRQTLITSLGTPVLLVGVIGLVRVVRTWDALPVIWRCTLTLALATIVFHALVPASQEPRYVIGALPGLLLLVVEGTLWLTELAARRWRRLPARTLAFGLLAATAFVFATRPSVPERLELDRVAEWIQQRSGPNKSAVLVSSPRAREVAFVAEIAARDTGRPHQFVVRANKLLAEMDWNGKNYRALARTPEEVLAALDRIPIRFVVVDTRATRGGLFPYHQLLSEALARRPEVWRKEESLPSSALSVYERTDSLVKKTPRVSVKVRGRRASGE